MCESACSHHFHLFCPQMSLGFSCVTGVEINNIATVNASVAVAVMEMEFLFSDVV